MVSWKDYIDPCSLAGTFREAWIIPGEGISHWLSWLSSFKWPMVSRLHRHTYCSDISKLSQKKIKKTKCVLELIQLYVSNSVISVQKKWQHYLITLEFFDQCNCKERKFNKMSKKWGVSYLYSRCILHGSSKYSLTSVNCDIKTVCFTCLLLQVR